MHNLLSTEQKREILHEYFRRVGSAALLLFSLAGIIAVVSLIPTYVATSGLLAEAEAEEATLAELVAKTETVDDPRTILGSMSAVATILTRTNTQQLVTTVIESASLLRSDGIVLTGFYFDRGTQTLVIEGLADRRDQLVTFSRRLEEEPSVASATLPIGDLAKSVNLRFRITLALRTDL